MQPTVALMVVGALACVIRVLFARAGVYAVERGPSRVSRPPYHAPAVAVFAGLAWYALARQEAP